MTKKETGMTETGETPVLWADTRSAPTNYSLMTNLGRVAIVYF